MNQLSIGSIFVLFSTAMMPAMLRNHFQPTTMHYRDTMSTSVSEPSLWIFGYGSLIWNPGFSYADSQKGYAIGFARRMYQGNTYHRGNESLPGRVATIIHQKYSTTNGVVFRVSGYASIQMALKHLEEREVENGYEFIMVPVQTAEEGETKTFMALTCIARTDYEYYLGPDRMEQMAYEIRTAKGCAGPNCEYVLKLAENVRRLFPEDKDPHLYALEKRIRSVSI